MSDESSESTHIFIDEKTSIYEGEQAAALLAEQAKKQFVDPQWGVVEVDQERWEEAQRYERRTWLENARRRFSDRNEYHRERFAGYTSILGRKFKRVIELGCGPFTNMRFILELCDIDQIHLLAPLIEDYLTHSFCKYYRRRMGGLLNENLGRLSGYLRHPLSAFLSKLNDWQIGGLSGRPVAIEKSMIETYETNKSFDLVVMINVLEHCRSAATVFEKIDQILLPDGIFVYHDKMYKAAEVERLSSVRYDAGHPLRVDQSMIEGFLNKHFEPLMRAEYLVHDEFHGLHMSYREIYFVGQKYRTTLSV